MTQALSEFTFNGYRRITPDLLIAPVALRVFNKFEYTYIHQLPNWAARRIVEALDSIRRY